MYPCNRENASVFPEKGCDVSPKTLPCFWGKGSRAFEERLSAFGEKVAERLRKRLQCLSIETLRLKKQTSTVFYGSPFWPEPFLSPFETVLRVSPATTILHTPSTPHATHNIPPHPKRPARHTQHSSTPQAPRTPHTTFLHPPSAPHSTPTDKPLQAPYQTKSKKRVKINNISIIS